MTSLLHRWREGDESALNQLMPLVYDELRRQARGMMKSERRDHTLQATALIHEASAIMPGSADRLVEIDDALERLKSLDERKYRALEMAIFGGLQQAEIAEVLGVSVPTIERDLRTARAWLKSEL